MTRDIDSIYPKNKKTTYKSNLGWQLFHTDLLLIYLASGVARILFQWGQMSNFFYGFYEPICGFC